MSVMQTKEAAEFLQMHPITLTKKAKAGLVPSRKVGGKWLFYKPHLIDWLIGHPNKTGADTKVEKDIALKLTYPKKSDYIKLLGLSDCPQIHSPKSDLLRGDCHAGAANQIAKGKTVELVGNSQLCENRPADDVRT